MMLRMRVLRWVSVTAAALALVWLIGRTAGGALPGVLEWVGRRGAAAPIAFMAAYAVAAVAMVPGSILTIAAGALFGIVGGTVYAFTGATLGAIGAFLVARHVARAPVERRLATDPRFERVDRAVGREGLRVVILLRLSPVFPYTLLNYALGLTRVRLRDFAVASVAMLPGTVLYVYSGRVAGDLVAVAAGVPIERSPGYWTVLGLGLVATLVFTLYITRLARRALRREDVDEASADAP
jgi:uncharacterized membrane protein YdjX (TVP38/TMEM64 family)